MVTRLADIRIHQAERLFGLSYRRKERPPPFEEYLSYVPPLTPAIGDPRHFTKPVLIDQSLALSRLCNKLNVGRKTPRATYANRHERPIPIVYWIWCHDGRHRVNVSPRECLSLFGPDEFGLGATEGLFLHAQYPNLARRRFVDLPGSTIAGIPTWVACLGKWSRRNRVWLHHVREDERHERCGSGSYCFGRDSGPG